MFLIALLVIILLILVWAAMVYVRKTMWDAVHRNLLDLEDTYKGRVIRRGFASRPMFHGTYRNAGVTINFSTERNPTGRRTYIDISYEKSASSPLTISNKNWLENQDSQELNDYKIIKNSHEEKFIVMPASDALVQKLIRSGTFIKSLDELDKLAYLFVSKTGLISEFISEQVIPDTQIEILEKRLNVLDTIIEEMKTLKS